MPSGTFPFLGVFGGNRFPYLLCTFPFNYLLMTDEIGECDGSSFRCEKDLWTAWWKIKMTCAANWIIVRHCSGKRWMYAQINRICLKNYIRWIINHVVDFNLHTCDKFQKGIREIFISFQGGLSKTYRIYRKILNSDEGDFEILVKSGMFYKNFYKNF